MSMSRDDHEKLDDLIALITRPSLHATVGKRAVVGVIAHLVTLAESGRKSEFKAWLHDPATYAAWFSTMSADYGRDSGTENDSRDRKEIHAVI